MIPLLVDLPSTRFVDFYLADDLNECVYDWDLSSLTSNGTTPLWAYELLLLFILPIFSLFFLDWFKFSVLLLPDFSLCSLVWLVITTRGLTGWAGLQYYLALLFAFYYFESDSPLKWADAGLCLKSSTLFGGTGAKFWMIAVELSLFINNAGIPTDAILTPASRLISFENSLRLSKTIYLSEGLNWTTLAFFAPGLVFSRPPVTKIGWVSSSDIGPLDTNILFIVDAPFELKFRFCYIVGSLDPIS